MRRPPADLRIGESMTTNEETAAAIGKAAGEAIAAAGRELSASLQHAMGEIGPRMVATTALGQVFAGLPDAARGMLAHLPPDQLHRVVDAANTLCELALDATPEGKAATEMHAATTPTDAQGLNDAGVYLDAWHQRNEKVAHLLGDRNVGQLLKMRGAAITLIAAIDRQVPRAS
jgi:hypothetical protein